MGLISGLIVQGLKKPVSTGISQAVSHGISGAISSGISNAVAQGVANSNTPTPATVAPVQVQAQAQPQAAADPGAQVGAPALSNAVSTALSNAMPDSGGGGDPAAAETEVEGVDVTAPYLDRGPDYSNIHPAPLSLVPAGVGLQQPNGPLVDDSGQPIDPTPALLGLGAGGILGALTSTPADITGPTAGGGGINPATLIGPAIAVGGALTGAGGAGGAEDSLKTAAEKSQALAGRLGSIAEAGFQGNIGGRGINTIEHQVRKAQAAIRQRYAAMGMSGSTAENDDLNAAAAAGVDLQFKVGQEMAQTGLAAVAALTGQSAAAYAQLLNAQTQKDTALGNALANFAAALVHP